MQMFSTKYNMKKLLQKLKLLCELLAAIPAMIILLLIAIPIVLIQNLIDFIKGE